MRLITKARHVWKNVDRRGPDECWPWLGAVNKRGGHGVAYIGNQESMSAHRAVYFLLVEQLPDSFVLDHVVCQNPICVNPAHLEPVPQAVNVQRGRVSEANLARAAAITHCPQGHPYDEENTYWYTQPKNGKTSRRCKICTRQRTDDARRGRTGTT